MSSWSSQTSWSISSKFGQLGRFHPEARSQFETLSCNSLRWARETYHQLAAS